MREKLLTIYLIVLIMVIGAIPMYAVNYRSSSNDTDRSIASSVSNIFTLDGDKDQLLKEEFSVSSLALDYLSTDSKIIVMGSNGVKHYNGSGANLTHCHMSICLLCEDSATDGVRYILSCNIIDPVFDNAPDLPFASSEIAIETEVKMPNYNHPKVSDEASGVTLDPDTYRALIQILEYYSGVADHDAYLDDPLLNNSIDYSFTITGPHFTLL